MAKQYVNDGRNGSSASLASVMMRVKSCGSDGGSDGGGGSGGGEYLSQKGAMALAQKLTAYWHNKGYPAARFWAEPIGERFDKVGTYEIYRVVSNLVNGLPPRYTQGYSSAISHAAHTQNAATHMAGSSC